MSLYPPTDKQLMAIVHGALAVRVERSRQGYQAALERQQAQNARHEAQQKAQWKAQRDQEKATGDMAWRFVESRAKHGAKINATDVAVLLPGWPEKPLVNLAGYLIQIVANKVGCSSIRVSGTQEYLLCSRH